MNQLVMERPASRTDRSRTAQRPTHRRAAPATTPAPHDVRTAVGVVAGVLLVLLLATWSFAQGWGRSPVAGPGEIAVDGGIVRVEGVVSAAGAEQSMPGMGTEGDTVAEGLRRISVEVTLMAGAGGLDYSVDGFDLTVDGKAASQRTNRAILPGDELPAGTRLSGTLVFDFPVGSTTGTLSYDGAGSTDIVLPDASDRAGGTAASGESMTDVGHDTGDAALDPTSAEVGR